MAKARRSYKKLVDDTVKQLDEVVRKRTIALAAEIVTELIKATPVDTGFARSNWKASVGSAAPSTVGSRERVSHGAPYRSIARLRAWRPKAGRIFIENHTPYIGPLNRGHSPQAAPGFIEATIERVGALFGVRLGGRRSSR